MNPDPDPGLEQQLDVALKKLPAVAAPPALMRQVLARIHAQARLPWWKRAWWDWPATAKVAFVSVAMILVTGLSGGGFLLSGDATDYSRQWTTQIETNSIYPGALESVSNAAALLWERVAQPLLGYVALAAIALYLLCVGLGTACVRFALNRS